MILDATDRQCAHWPIGRGTVVARYVQEGQRVTADQPVFALALAGLREFPGSTTKR